MRARAGLFSMVVALGALSACDGAGGTDAGSETEDASEPTGPRATLSWRMRCVSGLCPDPETPARSIDAVDGQDGAEISCDLTLEAGERRLWLTARSSEGYGIEIRGAKVGPDGGRLIGSFCQMRVFEPADVTTFGACSSNTPAADRPCLIQRVDIRDVDGVPTLTGEFRCASVTPDGDALPVRDVTSPTSSSAHAELTFTGCEGL